MEEARDGWKAGSGKGRRAEQAQCGRTNEGMAQRSHDRTRRDALAQLRHQPGHTAPRPRTSGLARRVGPGARSSSRRAALGLRMRTWWQMPERRLVKFQPTMEWRSGSSALPRRPCLQWGWGCARWSDTVWPQGQWGNLRADRGLPMCLNGGGRATL